MNEKSRVDITSAEDKSIGFDYQYYYFLNEILNLKTGQLVGLEVLDDVHIERKDGTKVLIQLKHTVQKNSDGVPKNLTTMDVDLWKSISNWCKVITDPAERRSLALPAQLAFISKTGFVLASNKSESVGNEFLSSLGAFKLGTKNHGHLVDDIRSIKLKSTSRDIQSYIDDLLNLDTSVSEAFFGQLSFVLGCDDIINQCKTSIAEKQIAATRIDDVFHAVDSSLREKSFRTVKAGSKISVSFDEFTKDYRRHFDRVRSGDLLFRKLTPVMPDNLVEQTFIRQLVDIADTSNAETEFLTKVTTNRLQYRNNLDRFVQDGDITQTDIDELEEAATTLWETNFRDAHHEDNETIGEPRRGRSILKAMRETDLKLASEQLPAHISHGGFYDLSDRPVIGWLKDWKERYQ
jgi:hypothetical protein